MAVFLMNICKFNDCGITFHNLGDLIQHIEEKHIDYDPLVVKEKEQEQPSCLPLSYVLKFFTEAAKKESSPDIIDSCKVPQISKTSFHSYIRTVPSNGVKEGEEPVRSDCEDSNDSWTTPEEYSSEFILKYGSKVSSGSTSGSSPESGNQVEKPFACPVPGCNKRYKNVNGIKYHSKNGHKTDGKIRKAFKCFCGKSYKSSSGLKNHSLACHNGRAVVSAGGGCTGAKVVQVSGTDGSPLRTLTLKNFGNLGIPLKTLVVTTKGPDLSSLGVLTPDSSPDSSSRQYLLPAELANSVHDYHLPS